jgi:hypothetical protein
MVKLVVITAGGLVDYLCLVKMDWCLDVCSNRLGWPMLTSPCHWHHRG